MTLQDQYSTPEQSKRLKELGVKFGAKFYYYENSELSHDNGFKYYMQTRSFKDFGEVKDGGVIKYYPALSCAELGVALPEESIRSFGLNPYKDEVDEPYWFCCYPCNGEWLLVERNEYGEDSIAGVPENYETEAQARAALLIHLLESGQTTAEQVNQRLNK